MNYEIEYMDFGGGDKMMCFVFEEENGVLGVFINGDAREFYLTIIEQIDKVLSGKKKQIESFGNECSWLIRPDFTFIRDNYALDESCCEMAVATGELRALVEKIKNAVEEAKNTQKFQSRSTSNTSQLAKRHPR